MTKIDCVDGLFADTHAGDSLNVFDVSFLLPTQKLLRMQNIPRTAIRVT